MSLRSRNLNDFEKGKVVDDVLLHVVLPCLSHKDQRSFLLTSRKYRPSLEVLTLAHLQKTAKKLHKFTTPIRIESLTTLRRFADLTQKGAYLTTLIDQKVKQVGMFDAVIPMVDCYLDMVRVYAAFVDFCINHLHEIDYGWVFTEEADNLSNDIFFLMRNVIRKMVDSWSCPCEAIC